MRKPSTEEKNSFLTYQKATKRYSDFELDQFEKDLVPFMSEKTDSDGAKMPHLDTKAFFVKKGALTPAGAVVIEDLRHMGDSGYDCKPIMYEELTNKLEQWAARRARRNIGQMKAFEETAKKL